MTTHRERASAPATDRTGVGWWVRTTASWLLLFVLVGLLVVTILVPLVVGGQSFTILTGSMEPRYSPGTLVVVRPLPAEKLAVGTPITYQVRSGDPHVVTHRIVSLRRSPDGQYGFVTRGDANQVDDEGIVRTEQIRGAVWYSIPYLGYLNNWFSGPKRTNTITVLIVLLAGYAVYAIATDTRDRRRADRERSAP